MNRRDFIKASASVAAVGLGLEIPREAFKRSECLADHHLLRLHIIDVMHEMVDETQVYRWAFSAVEPPLGTGIPGPFLHAIEGEKLRVTVINRLDEDHSFRIPGVVDTGPISPGENVTVWFTAPTAGTYIYEDGVNFPVGRVMGLHGVLVVLPAAGNTPYIRPTPQVQALFNDLGNSAEFPGLPWWDRAVESIPSRTKIWVKCDIDPRMFKRIQEGEVITPSVFKKRWRPRYFTINGRSGYFVHQDHDIALVANVGEPHLIRHVNVGMSTYSSHVHANHAYWIGGNGVVRNNVWWMDTWRISPGDRFDFLFPFIKPPDIPDDTWSRIKAGTTTEGFPSNPLNPQVGFPLAYPAHSHVELDNTAAGGNYPQGVYNHISITGTLV